MKQKSEDRKMQSNIKEEKTLAMPLTDFQLRRQTQLWVSYCCWPVCCKAFYLSIIICNRLLSSPPLPRYRVLVYICNNCCFRKWLHSTGGYRAAFWDQSSVARIRADRLLTQLSLAGTLTPCCLWGATETYMQPYEITFHDTLDSVFVILLPSSLSFHP